MERISHSCGRTTTSEVGLWCFDHSYVLRNCEKNEQKYKCVRTCESVWFKIWNVTEAGEYGQKCDKAFIGKYGNIVYVQRNGLMNREHGCPGMHNPFRYVLEEIGKTENVTLTMCKSCVLDSCIVGKKPETPHGYTEQKACIWEYDILGLWSMGGKGGDG